MQTHGGRAVSFLTPDPDSVDIEDICIALSRLPRFTAATRFVYTVAQHSLHVHTIVKETSPTDVAAHLWALCHDFHEAFTGDLSSPFQKAIETLIPMGCSNPVSIIQSKLDHAIAKHFAIDWNDVIAVKPLIKRADLIALATEKAQLMAVGQPWTAIDLPPVDKDVELMRLSPANTEYLLRSKFEQCLAAYRQSKNKRLEAAE